MGSRIKRLFFGKSSSSSNPKLKGKSYDSAIALDPPVQGSYPVAGNGPNVLGEIQRSRSKEAARRLSTIGSNAAAPTVPRVPEDIIERPRTAPHNGRPGGGHTFGGANDTSGRTRSGFTVKSPPAIFSSNNRRNSMRSTVEPPPPIPAPTPTSSTPKPREVKTYQPKKSAEPAEADIPETFTPPFALHHRNASSISHKSHVDLLEAHSNIRPSRNVSKHRAKASGVRNYGEDVADRNIADFRENQLDVDSPEFSYLKSVYVSKKGSAAGPRDGGLHARAGPALANVLGQDQTAGDNIQPPRNHTKANSTRPAQNNTSRPGVVFPPRTDSTSALSYSANRGRDDDRFTISNGVHDHRSRALSPFSSTTESIYEEPEDTSQQAVASARSTPPIPARGRARTWIRDNHGHNSPPVSLPSSFPRAVVPTQNQQTPHLAPPPSLKSRRRPLSETSQSTIATGGTKSRNNSVSFAIPPTMGRQDDQPNNESATRGQSLGGSTKYPGMIVQGAKEPPSLKGVVDLTNTVDTDVTTKTLPAVTHEKVLPARHEIREERITREIHTHDVFHRILPVIETEILPPKHYVPSPDGKGLVEIPEHMVPGRTAKGSPSRNWEIVETGMGRGDHGSMFHRKTPSKQSRRRSQSLTQGSQRYSHADIDEEDGTDGPVIGLAPGGSKVNSSRANSPTSFHLRLNSRTSNYTPNSSKTRNILEPVLSSKKEYITKEGCPKTEYVWRHPPVFETATGKTQPVYVGAGIGDLSSPTTAPISGEAYYSDEDDAEGAEFGAMRTPAKGEEGLLFQDSGYGNQGMLPGLQEKTPLAGLGGTPTFDPADFEVIRLGKVVGGDDVSAGKPNGAGGVEGEATKALRRMKEKRRSSGASTVKVNGNPVSEVEKGMNGLNVQE